MKQFWTVLSFELKSFLKNKVFVGMTLAMVLILAAVMFYPRISEALSRGEDESAAPAGALMLVKNESGMAGVTEAFSAAFSGYEVRESREAEEVIRGQITSGEAECAFVITAPNAFTYYIGNLSMYDMNTEIARGVMQELYRLDAMVRAGISPQTAGEIASVQIEGKTESLGKDQTQNYWYTYIMIFALYMVIMLYGQMVATGVAAEKSSRAMEVLVTSAKPLSMMLGKIVASCLAGFVQLAAIFGSAVLFYSVNKEYWGGGSIISSIFGMPPALLAYMLIFFLLGFMLYACMYGAAGSLASKPEDVSVLVMPITMLFVIGFVIVMPNMISGNVDNVLMRVCSFIPFTSSMAMFTRIAMSTVPWYEVAISVALLAAGTGLVGMLAAKIYRMGVLLYGTPPKLGALLKALRKA